MRPFYDIDAREFVTAPGGYQPFKAWEFMRGETGESIDLSFVRGGVVVELPGDAVGSFLIKKAGERDGDTLANAPMWEKVGSGENTIYRFAPDLTTDEINTALEHDADGENDVLTLAVEAQVLWIVDGKTYKTPIIEGQLVHDVNHGTEGVPTSGDPIYYNAAQIEALFAALPKFLPLVVGLTGGGSTKLDGQVTAGLSVPRLFDLVISGTLSRYLLRAGTDAEAAPGIIRPDDYAGGTNEKVYVQVG